LESTEGNFLQPPTNKNEGRMFPNNYRMDAGGGKRKGKPEMKRHCQNLHNPGTSQLREKAGRPITAVVNISVYPAGPKSGDIY